MSVIAKERYSQILTLILTITFAMIDFHFGYSGPWLQWVVKGKGKVFPYSLPSVGPGADFGVQAVSPQVT